MTLDEMLVLHREQRPIPYLTGEEGKRLLQEIVRLRELAGEARSSGAETLENKAEEEKLRALKKDC